MQIEIERFQFSDISTIGRLKIDGTFYCYTLENVVRFNEQKIDKKTAIPVGIYSVIVNVSPRFHRELPRVLNVPGYDGILIHRGNFARDTHGCILVGMGFSENKISESAITEIELVNKLKAEKGKIQLKIYNNKVAAG